MPTVMQLLQTAYTNYFIRSDSSNTAFFIPSASLAANLLFVAVILPLSLQLLD